ncbi:MAG TPA: Flp family type IVb pilin [Patescibacteria group bacterium]|nr:Flp family type IVb pilin [Patescibacteria group bacterium]
MALINYVLGIIDRFRSDEEGQGLAEYALILSLIAIVAIAALLVLGPAIADILEEVGSALNAA